MIDYIKRMMKTVGIKPKYEDGCKIEDKYWNNKKIANLYKAFDDYMNKNCLESDSGACFSTCEYAYNKKVYPPFTAEKQLEIIKLLSYTCDLYCRGYHMSTPEVDALETEKKGFSQTLAQLVIESIAVKEIDKEKVKEILEK